MRPLEGTRASDDAEPTAGNQRLTSTTGVVLVPLLGLVFLTGLAMDAYWHVHYVIGFVLIPVVGLKLLSTGYRAARYYTGSATYRAMGPPQPLLRLLAPVLVLAVGVALVTGVALFLEKSRTGTLSTLHTDSSVVSAGLLGLHLLAYARGALRASVDEFRRPAVGGRAVRIALVSLAVAVGVGIAAATYSDGIWPARPFQLHER